MAHKRLFLIGDIHGCLDCLKHLIDAVEYHPQVDTILFAGDLVNRGPSSVQTLRFVKSLSEGGNCTVVLGNHDIHLLFQAAGAGISSNRFFQSVFEAHDSHALLEWLRHQSILHIDAWHGFFLVHAGLAPQWSMQDATTLAEKIEHSLRSDDWRDFLHQVWDSKELPLWNENGSEIQKLHYAITVFTRIRFCRNDGTLDFQVPPSHTQSPPDAKDVKPWFSWPNQRKNTLVATFGHWSVLGFRHLPGAIALDSGCVWGGFLSAYEWYSAKVHQVPCQKYAKTMA